MPSLKSRAIAGMLLKKCVFKMLISFNITYIHTSFKI